MKIEAYIEQQLEDRRDMLTALHSVILQNDPTVVATIAPMMGKEMILYIDRGMMKYGLASVKNYLSLHVLPIYGSASLHQKYQALLPLASFQKGCINFKNELEMPVGIVQGLIADCAPIDLIKIRTDYLQSKKKK